MQPDNPKPKILPRQEWWQGFLAKKRRCDHDNEVCGQNGQQLLKTTTSASFSSSKEDLNCARDWQAWVSLLTSKTRFRDSVKRIGTGRLIGGRFYRITSFFPFLFAKEEQGWGRAWRSKWRCKGRWLKQSRRWGCRQWLYDWPSEGSAGRRSR